MFMGHDAQTLRGETSNQKAAHLRDVRRFCGACAEWALKLLVTRRCCTYAHAMKACDTDLAHQMAAVAEDALAASGMDVVGLYLFDEARGMQGVIRGLPRAFHIAYETQGIAIDPVLARMRDTGTPTSTLLALGDRWRSCALYQRVSGRFGLTGFATLPLFRDDSLSGVLYLGATTSHNANRLDAEGVCGLSVHATRSSVKLLKPPRRHMGLTQRQDAVAALAARGLTNREIAEELRTGTAAIHKHMKSLNRIFGTSTRTAMAARWLETSAQ